MTAAKGEEGLSETRDGVDRWVLLLLLVVVMVKGRRWRRARFLRPREPRREKRGSFIVARGGEREREKDL